MDLDTTLTIWADPKTEEAVRIEVAVSATVTVVLKNYQADIEYEKEDFRLELPDGYTEAGDVDVTISEESLVETLRITCEAGDGNFPASLDLDSIANATTANFDYLIEANSESGGMPDSSGLIKGAIGFSFVTSLVGDPNSEVYYAGAQIKFGESCLLYTSPSPRDTTLSRMPSSA